MFLIRLFGGKSWNKENQDKFLALDRTTQFLICYKYGDLGYGPKMYGAFDGGRVEEYIHSRLMTGADFFDQKLQQQIAHKLALFHHMRIPMTDRRLEWVQVANERFAQCDIDASRTYHREMAHKGDFQNINQLLEWSWREVDVWLQKTRVFIHSPIVLCTNDRNASNTLVREQPDQLDEYVTLIDFEAASLSERGKDIGMHFWWYMADVTSPTFLSGYDYPSEAIRSDFIRMYLNESQKIIRDREWDAEGLDSVEHVLHEAEYFAIVGAYYMASFAYEPFRSPIDPFGTPDGIIKLYHTASHSINFIKERIHLFQQRFDYLFQKTV